MAEVTGGADCDLASGCVAGGNCEGTAAVMLMALLRREVKPSFNTANSAGVQVRRESCTYAMKGSLPPAPRPWISSVRSLADSFMESRSFSTEASSASSCT